MNRATLNIAVYEYSAIIFEGLSNILSKSGHYYNIHRIDSLSEIERFDNSNKPEVVIINPDLVQNITREFIILKKKLPDTLWIGLVYSYFNQNLLSLFDELINITDSPGVIFNLISRARETGNTNHMSADEEQLSEREIDVLKLLVAGLSNKEIADKLFISIHTVVSHRKNISQKTGIKSQAGLTIYAISRKIIHIEDYQN